MLFFSASNFYTMKVLNSIQARLQPQTGEVNKLPSKTIPDQEITPSDLLRRYATGQPLGLNKIDAIYDSDHDMEVPELYKMNKMDKIHHIEQNSQNLSDLTEEYEHQKRKQKAQNELQKREGAEQGAEQSGESVAKTGQRQASEAKPEQ